MPALPASPTAAALKLLFPIVLIPFGIAAVIVLLAWLAVQIMLRGLRDLKIISE
jgi:hypothetical protein